MQQNENRGKYGALALINARMPLLHPETRAVLDRVLNAHGIPHTDTTMEDAPGPDWDALFDEASESIHALLKPEKEG